MLSEAHALRVPFPVPPPRRRCGSSPGGAPTDRVVDVGSPFRVLPPLPSVFASRKVCGFQQPRRLGAHPAGRERDSSPASRGSRDGASPAPPGAAEAAGLWSLAQTGSPGADILCREGNWCGEPPSAPQRLLECALGAHVLREGASVWSPGQESTGTMVPRRRGNSPSLLVKGSFSQEGLQPAHHERTIFNPSML